MEYFNDIIYINIHNIKIFRHTRVRRVHKYTNNNVILISCNSILLHITNNWSIHNLTTFRINVFNLVINPLNDNHWKKELIYKH